LADFFRHAFDGSGADNFFDAGDGGTGAMYERDLVELHLG
jgi:hypothetical protein